MADLRQRLYTTKLTVLALVLVVAGFLLMTLGAQLPATGIVGRLPVADIGSALLTTGVIGVLLMYLDAKDAEERASARLRRIIAEEAPAIRDAVIDGFAFSPDALTSVMSPDVLDRIVRNSLGLQLKDAQMAADLHRDLLLAAMDPVSRYSDSRLSVRLAAAAHHRDMLRLTMHREYRFAGPPPIAVRFSCVLDEDDYREALRDPETTEVWRLHPDAQHLVGDPEAFTVLDVFLDGEPQATKRIIRKGGVTFTGPLTAVEAAQHHLAYTYEVLVPRSNPYLYFDFGRPTFGLEYEFDAEPSAGVKCVRVLDFLGGPDKVRRAARPDVPTGGTYSVGYDGWVLPPAGVVAIWREK